MERVPDRGLGRVPPSNEDVLRQGRSDEPIPEDWPEEAKKAVRAMRLRRHIEEEAEM